MDRTQIESQFKEKLRELYRQHGSLQQQFSEGDFVSKFTIQYKDGRPHQPVGPEDGSVDPVTFQKVMAAFNDVYP